MNAKQGVGSGSLEACESSDSSEQSDDSDRSDEDAPRRSRTRNRTAPPARNTSVVIYPLLLDSRYPDPAFYNHKS